MIGRITVLGGSSVYTPEFILSVISHNVNVKEIVLVGRRKRKLDIVSQFCQRLLDKSGFPIKILGTCDVAEGVAGAKYILNHIRVGGMRARLRDEKVPLRFGMIGSENRGAGGFTNAMRIVPVLIENARIIERVNPEVTFINLSNPMGVVVEALAKYSRLNVIGVCDLPNIYLGKIAKLLHQSQEDLWVDYFGMNHMGWIQDIKIRGRSCMSQMLEKLEKVNEDGFDGELIRLFRMVPTKTASLYFRQNEILKLQRPEARFRAEVLQEAEQQILKLYEDRNLCEVPDLTHERKAVWYDDTILPLIDAVEGRKETEVVLCVRNGQSIRNLPEDCSVEIPVGVSNRGLKPRQVGSCPRFLQGLFAAIKESDRLTIEAAIHRSYDLALQALTINPLVPSFDVARRFLDHVAKEEKLELH